MCLLHLISQLGHEVYQPGASGYSQVVEEFGEGRYMCMSVCSHHPLQHTSEGCVIGCVIRHSEGRWGGESSRSRSSCLQ